MGIPLYDLQIGFQRGQIQRGGRLAHAAADLVHRLALDIGGRGLIAPGGGPLAHDLVIVEDVAAVEHRSVHRSGGQLHVADAGGGAADVGGVRPQHIPEQNALELLGRDGGILDLGRKRHRLARRGSVHFGLGQRRVELRAGLLGNDGLGLGVIARVFHLTGGLVIDLLGGHGLGCVHGIGNVQRQVPAPAVRLQRLRQRRRVHAASVLRHGDHELGILKGIGRVLRGEGERVRRAPGRRCGPVPVQRDRAGRAAGGSAAGEIPPAVCKEAAAAVCRLRVPDQRRGVHLRAKVGKGDLGVRSLRALRRLALRAVIEVEVHRHTGDGGAQLPGGLLRGQPAHVLIQNAGAAPERVAAAGKGAQARVSRGQQPQHHRGDHNGEPGAALLLLVYFQSIHGFLPARSETERKSLNEHQYSTFSQEWRYNFVTMKHCGRGRCGGCGW